MGDQDAPPFGSVAIVGVGLIGGSIALGIRERWPSVRVFGVDRPAVLAHAAGSGALDKALSSVAELPGVELVILAAPVRQNARLLTELPAHVRQSAIVTDVGGTKRDMQKAAAVVGPSLQFVGGHPIGGAEHGGFGFARPDLFRGRPWILTPTAADADADAVRRLTRLAEGLGARPVTMDAAEHDRVMAFVSHLPQLATSALMEVIGSAVQGEGL
ncbi:MAG TPA: prephenate dehydrogenase/arogenate dehydrogenase family protein, partial [Vicinamibacterales bacterium]